MMMVGVSVCHFTLTLPFIASMSENSPTYPHPPLPYFPYREHIVQPSSHELVPQMDLEVDVVWCVHNGVDELETGQLQHGVVGLLQSGKNWFKPVYPALFAIDSNSFQNSIMTT